MMTEQQKTQITEISKQFASGFDWEINGSGFTIVDPLSAYLNSLGYKNTLGELPKNEQHPQILVMTFRDGSRFIPAGGDLKPVAKAAENWMWI